MLPQFGRNDAPIGEREPELRITYDTVLDQLVLGDGLYSSPLERNFLGSLERRGRWRYAIDDSIANQSVDGSPVGFPSINSFSSSPCSFS